MTHLFCVSSKTPSLMNFPKDSQKRSYSEDGSLSPDSEALAGLLEISISISRVLLTSCFLMVRTMRDSCSQGAFLSGRYGTIDLPEYLLHKSL